MISRAAFAVIFSFLLLACGVKSDLRPPEGRMPDQHEPDPSKPPRPLGQ